MFKFLKSRIAWYIIIATASIISVLSGVIWYQFERIGTLNETVGKLETQMETANKKIEEQNSDIETLQEKAEISDQTFKRFKSDVQSLQADKRNVNNEIQRLKENNREVADYLDSRIPPVLYQRLRESD